MSHVGSGVVVVVVAVAVVLGLMPVLRKLFLVQKGMMEYVDIVKHEVGNAR